MSEVSEPELRSLAAPADMEVLSALRPTSLAMVPLYTGERSLGTLALASADSGQVFTADDLALFRSVAQHAALALTSAEMYETAERARLEREEVLAIVSHDLRNPLNTVGFAASIMGLPGVTEERRAAQLELIDRAVREMIELIDRLLDAARIDSGRFNVEPAPLSLDALLAEALRRATPAAERAGVHLEAPPASRATVLADRGRLLQVLGNLLSNAVSFSPPGGTVAVDARLEAGEACISVRDEGPGMDEEMQRHVFDRYWQARQSGRAGAGLGLSIAQGVVHAHGGRIGVHSGPGQGSEFYFTIPRSGETPTSASETQPT